MAIFFYGLLALESFLWQAKDRSNSIENIGKTLGKPSAIFAAFCLILAFLSWYIFQLKSAETAIDDIFQIDSIKTNILSIRSGAALGLLGALLAIGGIKIIKWINLICLPILIIYQIFGLIVSKNTVILSGNWELSFSAIGLIIIYLLPGTVNLPTFFRHSRSLADSYLALTLMAFLFTFFQMSSIWLTLDNSSLPIFKYLLDMGFSFKLLTTFFVILFTICNIVVNIYFASASWEAIVPKFGGAKEYAIIGLIGTAAYTFIQISPPMKILINLANYYIANLGVVLILTFLLGIFIKDHSKVYIRRLGSASWLFSCIVATILELYKTKDSNILLLSMEFSALFFLSAIFIEESIWSIKKIVTKNRKKNN
ncbi:MAG: hypothetical protein KR126chlam6_01246 [Candidatus Anoxychlamydiales bacterium]|nr:hypothetical protein [Candidatus Anoxychlamydiales bacterium]